MDKIHAALERFASRVWQVVYLLLGLGLVAMLLFLFFMAVVSGLDALGC